MKSCRYRTRTAFILLVNMTVSCCGSNARTENNSEPADTSVVSLNGKLQVVGTQLCKEQGEPVVLRGASLGWHNLWPRFYNEGAVKWLAEVWKCTVVRAAMGLEIGDNYRENPEFALQCITPVIEADKNETSSMLLPHAEAEGNWTEELLKPWGKLARNSIRRGN